MNGDGYLFCRALLARSVNETRASSIPQRQTIQRSEVFKMYG